MDEINRARFLCRTPIVIPHIMVGAVISQSSSEIYDVGFDKQESISCESIWQIVQERLDLLSKTLN